MQMYKLVNLQVHSSPGRNFGKSVHSNLKEKVNQRFSGYDSNQRHGYVKIWTLLYIWDFKDYNHNFLFSFFCIHKQTSPPPAFGSTTEVEYSFDTNQLHDIDQPGIFSW